MTHHYLHMILAFRTFMETWTISTHFSATLVFFISIPFRSHLFSFLICIFSHHKKHHLSDKTIIPENGYKYRKA